MLLISARQEQATCTATAVSRRLTVAEATGTHPDRSVTDWTSPGDAD